MSSTSTDEAPISGELDEARSRSEHLVRARSSLPIEHLEVERDPGAVSHLDDHFKFTAGGFDIPAQGFHRYPADGAVLDLRDSVLSDADQVSQLPLGVAGLFT